MTGVDATLGHDDSRGPMTVIFVCTHNSARSIMAEALLRDKGGDAYAIVSAGTDVATVRPFTLRVLEEAGLPTRGLRSKSVTEFVSRRFDYVITVCDSARRACPAFPGEGERLHWSFPDPSAAEGTDDERLEAFRHVFTAISQRIDLFVSTERPAPEA